MFGTGNPMRASMRAIHSISIALWILTAPAWAAYDFVTNKYLEMTFEAGTLAQMVPSGSGALTVFCWVNTDSGGAGGDAVYLGDAASDTNHIRIMQNLADSKILTWQRAEVSVSYAWSSTTPTPGTWVSIGFTEWANGTTRNLYKTYVNGELGNDDYDGSTFVHDTYTKLAIGRLSDSTPDSYLDGKVEQVAVWTRALTADEHTSLSQGYAPSFFSEGLLWYFPLVDDLECAVSTYTLTAYNSPSVVEGPEIIYPSDEPPAPVMGKGGYGLFPGMRRH